MAKRSRQKNRPSQATPPPKDAKAPPQALIGERAQILLVCVLLAVVTLTVFSRVGSCGFVNLDDPYYVTQNDHVKAGLSWGNVRWAFTTTYFGLYYPLTWLSHMTDAQLFGLGAGGHHLTSLIFHALNSVLLFLLLVRMTRALWRSSLVAALFAVHPLHVESVAWIAERKDVLSTFLWFLCLLAYAIYAEKPSAAKSSLVFVLFVLGMMAKPMLITLPFTLLLLDFWPLGRWPSGDGQRRLAPPGEGPGKPATFKRLVIEKLPLFLLVPVFGEVTWISQRNWGAVIPTETIPLTQRVANALISCCTYVWKMLVPVNLAVFYPHPRASVSYGLAAVCGLTIAAATVAALWLGRERKYLAVGWLWYLGTLVPVIGLAQVGQQAMADRYTYVPLTGIFIAAVWSATELCDRMAIHKPWRVAAAAAVLLPLALAARSQTGWWKDSITLLEHSLKVTGDNNFVEMNLGAALSEAGRDAQALESNLKTLQESPGDAASHFNVGVSLFKIGRLQEAVAEYRKALEFKCPATVQGEIHSNLAVALINLGQQEEALPHLDAAISLIPGNVQGLVNKAMLLTLLKRPSEALELFAKAIELDPRNAATRFHYGNTLASMGRFEEAVVQYRKSLEAGGTDSFSVDAHVNLGRSLAELGRPEEALPCFDEALAMAPDEPRILAGKARILTLLNRQAEAAELYRRIQEKQPAR